MVYYLRGGLFMQHTNKEYNFLALWKRGFKKSDNCVRIAVSIIDNICDVMDIRMNINNEETNEI